MFYTFSDLSADVNMWYVIPGGPAYSHTLKPNRKFCRGGPLGPWTIVDRLPKMRQRHCERPRQHSQGSIPQIRKFHPYAVLGGGTCFHAVPWRILEVLSFQRSPAYPHSPNETLGLNLSLTHHWYTFRSIVLSSHHHTWRARILVQLHGLDTRLILDRRSLHEWIQKCHRSI